MPGGDGRGPDGNGPKSTNKGWPERYGHNGGSGARTGGGRRLRRRDGSCQQTTNQAGRSDK